MKQKICGLLAMLLLLSGCGSSTPADTSPMSEDEITQMYSDPDSFKGRSSCTAVCSTSQSTMTTACISRCGETRRTESATRS